MEDEILILLFKNDDCKSDAARDVADMILSFIEWKDSEVGLYNKRSGLYLYWEDYYTISTLFEYWFKYIKK